MSHCGGGRRESGKSVGHVGAAGRREGGGKRHGAGGPPAAKQMQAVERRLAARRVRLLALVPE